MFCGTRKTRVLTEDHKNMMLRRMGQAVKPSNKLRSRLEAIITVCTKGWKAFGILASCYGTNPAHQANHIQELAEGQGQASTGALASMCRIESSLRRRNSRMIGRMAHG